MEEVKQDFLESLQELTFNSRPIIQGLTEVAQECSEFGKGVADAVEYHLSTCAVPLKIPALYLMDSIIKNIPVPYDDIFAPKAYRMITESYRHLQPPQKQKVIDLFRTWTQPQPKTGAPVFHDDILSQIDGYFCQVSQAQAQPQPQQQQRLNQSSVQVEINRMLNYLKSVTQDKDTEYQIGTLQRLQVSISGSVDQNTLMQAQQQIENFKQRQESALRKRQNQRGGRDRGDKRKKPYGRDRDSNGATGSNREPLRERGGVGEQQSTGAAPPAAFPDLLSNLQSAGLLNTIGTPISVNAPPTADVHVTIDLTSTSLNTARPELIAQLYSVLPVQCSVCGKRFPDTPEGRAAKQDELDWHFRVNKDVREGRSHSRMWFLTAQQWVNYDESEPVQTEEEPKIDFEGEAKKVVPVPEDHDGICHICQEKFNTVWSEDAEEWVYQNAVEASDHIFHATCYADPNNKPAIDGILSGVKPE